MNKENYIKDLRDMKTALFDAKRTYEAWSEHARTEEAKEAYSEFVNEINVKMIAIHTEIEKLEKI